MLDQVGGRRGMPWIEIAPEGWLAAVETLKADGLDYFDWLGCVDEIGRQDSLPSGSSGTEPVSRSRGRVLSCSLSRTIRGSTASVVSLPVLHGMSVRRLNCLVSSSSVASAVGCSSIPTLRELRCVRMRC